MGISKKNSFRGQIRALADRLRAWPGNERRCRQPVRLNLVAGPVRGGAIGTAEMFGTGRNAHAAQPELITSPATLPPAGHQLDARNTIGRPALSISQDQRIPHSQRFHEAALDLVHMMDWEL